MGKDTSSHAPFTDHQFHRLPILITGKHICTFLLKPDLDEAAPFLVRVVELDILEAVIVVKQADRTIEHVAMLPKVCHGQCERVQRRHVVYRCRDMFLVMLTLEGIGLFNIDGLTKVGVDRHVNISKRDI